MMSPTAARVKVPSIGVLGTGVISSVGCVACASAATGAIASIMAGVNAASVPRNLRKVRCAMLCP